MRIYRLNGLSRLICHMLNFRVMGCLAVCSAIACTPCFANNTADTSNSESPRGGLRKNLELTAVDTIVASVNGKPITLRELGEWLKPPRTLSLQEAARDPEARSTLDQLILDLLIRAEAEQHKVRASEQDIEQYMNELARQNNMTREDLEGALRKEEHSLQRYRRRVQIDILRSRLVGKLMRDGTAVRQEEVDESLAQHPASAVQERRVTLRQILLYVDKQGVDKQGVDKQGVDKQGVNKEGVNEQGVSEQEEQLSTESRQSFANAQTLALEIQEKLESGASFEELARIYSNSGDAAQGGLLGTIPEAQLSPTILDAVIGLDPGEHSTVVRTPQGLHFFQLVERTSDNQDRGQLAAEVRESLSKQKMEERLATYFTVELYKRHSVDKKI